MGASRECDRPKREERSMKRMFLAACAAAAIVLGGVGVASADHLENRAWHVDSTYTLGAIFHCYDKNDLVEVLDGDSPQDVWDEKVADGTCRIVDDLTFTVVALSEELEDAGYPFYIIEISVNGKSAFIFSRVSVVPADSVSPPENQ
ncbi:hypothetical protein A2673_00680 [Candidatus Kaiserbacteria bacterium RIFCSPHIGHO2_01_FULL_50_13]|nr:MAG: hypothetical protein A2673_00680 [Candidatus Kaiserbacteria bacterium RIFCSPHIGHO2_01_FULL_50_13]